jgi:adenosine kinase
LNLSAPYIPQSFGVELRQILPYCDIVIGNDSEAEAWANANKLENSKDLHAIARDIASLPKSNGPLPRTVVITRGAGPTLLISSARPNNPQLFPVAPLKDEEIVDTNGAGDAFAGGFLAAYVSGRKQNQCVEAGHKLAKICIGQVRLMLTLTSSAQRLQQIQIGPQYKWPKVSIL